MVPSKRDLVIFLPIQIQYFPFFPTFMKYILQNSSPKLLLKLYQCCKYFYFKSKITIAPNVYCQNHPSYHFERINFNNKSFKHCLPNTEKLWLTDKFHVKIYDDDNGYSYQSIGNQVLNKIFRNNLKELKIESKRTDFKDLEILLKSPNLTKVELATSVEDYVLNKIFRNNLKKLKIESKRTDFKELEILLKSPNLTKAELATSVEDYGGNLISVEEIMILVPQVEHFEIFSTNITLESFNKLSKVKFLNKFQRVCFYKVRNEFDPITMCKFLEENFGENADFRFTLRSQSLHLELCSKVKELIDGWKTKKIKHFYFH
uniref:DUF38 domain-containing protein n=2 Tax=Panagrolaimus sp. PS1159 TaxID=55785 RepID=A0AC35F9H5_9BILA